MLRHAALAFALVCAGCTGLGISSPMPACRTGDAMVETQLFFGMSKPTGGTVSAAQWQGFVKREVAPRFPEGFTVFDGAGFWLDGTTRRTISEKSKVIVRLHGDDAASEQTIAAIADAYKTQFQQEAVLRLDRPVCATF